MNKLDKEKLDWNGIGKYTIELKEWLFKLLLKIQARLGHIEEELYKVKDQNKATYSIKKKTSDDGVDYILINDTTKEERGTISISAQGVNLSTWEEDLNV